MVVSPVDCAHGIDVLRAQDANMGGQPDPVQLAYATAQERMVVTHDVDYLTLHASGVQHAGIAYCKGTKYSVGQLIYLLILLHATSDRQRMRNHVEYL